MKRINNKSSAVLAVISIIIAFLIVFSFGCAKKDETREIKIGAILPLTGDIASYGVKVKGGAEIALNNLKKEGIRLNIDFQDDHNDPKTAVNIMQSFSNINKYPVVIGAAGSSVSLAIAPIANQNRIVQISPLSSAADLSEKGGSFFFRVCPADDQQAEIMAEWIKNDGANAVAVVYTDNSWGSGLANSFKTYYEKRGGKIVLLEATGEGQTDFRTVLSKVKAAKVDALYSPTYPKEGGVLVRQAKELGLKINLYGADNWGAPEFTQIARTAANGTRFVSQSSYSGPEFQELNNQYKSKYGKDADVFVAYGFDAVIAIAKAIRMSSSLNGDEIRKSLLSVKFQGASGYIEFNANGDLKTNAFTKKEIKDGKVHNI